MSRCQHQDQVQHQFQDQRSSFVPHRLLPPRTTLPTRPRRLARSTIGSAIERKPACVVNLAGDANNVNTLDLSSKLRRQKQYVAACLLLLTIAGMVSIYDNAGTVDAQAPPPTLFTPPRGTADDLWADAVVGKPDFNSIAPNQITDEKLFWVNGALVSTNTNGNGAKLFVYDAGNNRILVADVASCMATPGPNCDADFAIGQPNMRTAGCNHDSGFQGFPVRADAGSDTLCTHPEYSMSVSETGSGASMALDNQGRLFVADYFNHRVLRYPNPFGTPTAGGPGTATPTPSTPTVTATAIRADVVIGQADFAGNKCNRSQPISLADRDSRGDIVGTAPDIPTPHANTLCFDWGSNTGYPNNNWVAGVDLDAQGNLWVVDSGNNRVLRFPYNAATDTFSPDADRVFGQTSFETRGYGSGLDQLSNPSVVRVDKRTGEVYVADQNYNESGYQRVLVFGPTINPPPTSNVGRIFGYYPNPLGLDFDVNRPDRLWINANGADQLQAWKINPTPTPPSLEQILGGGQQYLGGPAGSIGIDDQTNLLPPPLNQFELLFSSAQRDAHRNDIVAFGLPRSPTPLPGPSIVPTPIKSLFGYGGSSWGNLQSSRALAEGQGVAVSNNPIRPQLFASDYDRILFWDNPTTSWGQLNLTNGQEGTPVATPTGTPETILQMKATQNYLYVTKSAAGGTQNWVAIYQLPVEATSTPVAVYAYPYSFVTVDNVSLQHYSTYSTRSASLFIAPTSDDQYLWVGVTDDSRIVRVRNPLNLTPTGTPDPNQGKVDVILGQPDLYNYGCNTQKVTAWASPTNVAIVGNTITKNQGVNGVWDAGARSVATISAPESGSWDSLKGYAQLTVDVTNTTRAFGLKYDHSPTPTPAHDYQDIDFAIVLTGTNTLQIYERSAGTIYTGTYGQNDLLRVAVEASGGNPTYLYRIVYYRNETVLATTYPSALTFPLYLKGSIATIGGSINNAYLAASQRQNVTDSTLCLASFATVDRQGNLWVSDSSLEQQGNTRLLEYDTNLFPSNPTSVSYAIPASRIFPDLATWEPAFDRQNNLFVGYNHYRGSANPPPPTPLPGTPMTTGNFVGRFPGVYINPLYPLPSYTATPAPTSSPSATPTATRPAPRPDALLADLYSMAYAATFDDYDNLYVRDLNRSRVMIYQRPAPGTAVTWATPLMNVTVTPTTNSIQKTSGTNEVWDAGAVSVQAIGAGNGYVMISVETPTSTGGTPTRTPTGTSTPQPGGLNTRRAFGLSSSSRFHAHRLQDLDFAFVLTGTNSLNVYERGTFIAQAGTYDYGDALKVAVEDGPGNQSKVVRYYHNGAAVYTNTNPLLDYPLQLDTSIATMGGRITNATIFGSTLVTCSASGWCTGTSKNAGSRSELNGAVAIPPTSNLPLRIWAVGSQGEEPSIKSLVQYWDGSDWTIVNVSSFQVGMLNGVSASTDGTAWYMWAVGGQGVLFYDGRFGTWSRINVNGLKGKGVYARTTTDVWTVGDSTQGIWHWDGTSWSQTSLPSGYTLNGVTAISSSNAWAVGQYSGQVLIMHWDGSSWSTVTAPSPGTQASLASVDAYDANHIWAVGTYIDAQGHSRNLTEYWNGTQWIQISVASPGQDSELHSVRFTREGSVWAVGDYQDANSSQPQKTSILLWNGTAWSMEDNPNLGISSTLMGLTTIAGSNPVITGTWAVGSYTLYEGAPLQTLVETLKAPTPPLTTTTYYVTTVSQSTNYSLGCQAGLARESGNIVLDYGQPRLWDPGPNQRYGTLLIGSQDKAYITDPTGTGKDITTAVEKFIRGYADCRPQQSFGAPMHATIAIGTNNNNLDGQAALTAGHAQAWANMVSIVQAYVINNELESLVDVQGAIDLQPDWSTYTLAHDWVQAYTDQKVSFLYNFGSTNGYPAVPPGEPTPVVPPPWAYSNWDSSQLYKVSWGIPSILPMPQILQRTFSKDWHAVARWAINSGLPPIQFAGEASASTLCPSITQAPGTGACFDPQQSWQVFFHELAADPLGGIPQPLDRATDIKCSNGSTSQGCK